MQRLRGRYTLALVLTLSFPCNFPQAAAGEPGLVDWAQYGGDAGQRRYSSLRQINVDNVSRLTQAWIYRSGEPLRGFSQWQSNPLVVDGVLYTMTPGGSAVALDAADGKEVWRFDALVQSSVATAGISRGVAYWRTSDSGRLFLSIGPYLYCLDAASGLPVRTFGAEGRIDLREGLGRDPQRISVDATSPGAVYRDLIIVGTRVAEGSGAAPGHIRAYDVRTGAPKWIFHTIPHPGELGHDTWPVNAWRTAGGANAWAGLSVDAARGMVFVPTGSASYDFYGADRHGDNLFANTLLALDAATGRRAWHFQTVHHDLWDRDLPAPPTLATLGKGDRKVDVVAQITKQGFTFVLDRETGTPYHPIDERPVPPSELPGERASSTQPFPVKPPPFARQAYAREFVPAFDSAVPEKAGDSQSVRYGQLYSPPDLRKTAMMPSYDGGAEWGGAAFDEESGLLYVNASDVPVTLQMTRLAGSMRSSGRGIYLQHCAGCHGAERSGTANMPALAKLGGRYSMATIYQLIRSGRARMPGFPQLSFSDALPLVTYLLDEADNSASGDEQRQVSGATYIHTGYEALIDPQSGAPAVAPPWGTLTAIDLERGEFRWRIPLGYYPNLEQRFGRGTGAQNYGGPIVTAGGVVFIAATPDEMIRAYDKATGRQLWEAKLPAAGFATPATYMVGGRQYVVIAAGGGKLGRPSGDALIAFALPEPEPDVKEAGGAAKMNSGEANTAGREN